MLRFIVNLFALIGLLVVALIVWAVVAASQVQTRLEPEPSNVILSLDFTRSIAEQTNASPFSLASGGEPMALLDIVSAIDHAAKDPNVKGIAARFGAEQPAFAQAEEIHAALQRFRASGKFSYAFGTDFGEFGTGNRTYYLASAFENIWLQPVGTVSLTGLAMQAPFGKAALDKLGVSADFMQREEYKSLMEEAQRDRFSEPVKAEMQKMIDNLSDQVARGIAAGRKWDTDHVKSLMARGPFIDEEALQEGLVSRLGYEDELEEELTRKAGADAKKLDLDEYLGYVNAKAKASDQTVAIVYASGLILDKAFDGDVFGERVLGAETMTKAVKDASENEKVKAIVLRVDSPGGSPAASESIRRAIVHAKKKGKPIIVSMGSTAASGGYWIAMNGDRIIADPATITGSIGVVAGKFAADALLLKLGISVDGVATAPNAGMWSPASSFSPVQRERVNTLLDGTYRAFVNNVAAARKIPVEKMPEIAKGRVFTGEQALQAGLVDELGGLDTALAAVRKALNLAPDAVLNIERYPAPESPAERLLKIMRRLSLESASLAGSLKNMNAVLSPLLGMFSMATHPIAAQLPPTEVVRD